MRHRLARTAATVHTITDALSSPAGWLFYVVAAVWITGRLGSDLARTWAPDWLLITTLIAAGAVCITAVVTEPTTDEQPPDCC